MNIKTASKKELDIILIAGVAFNILAIIFIFYMYYISIPRKIELKSFAPVAIPNVESATLESELNSSKKADVLPIELDETKIGKQNPYF